MSLLQSIIFGIIYVLFAHFVADFLFQTEKMAINKSKSIKWLTLHVVTYTLVFGILIIIPFHTFGFVILKWIGINAILHWCVDFVTSRVTTYLYVKKKYRKFFNVIGFDQFLHFTSIFGTLLLL